MKHKQCRHLRDRLFLVLFLFLVSFSLVSSLDVIAKTKSYYSSFLAYFGFGKVVLPSNIFFYSILVGILCMGYYHLVLFLRVLQGRKKPVTYGEALSKDKMFLETPMFRTPLELGMSPYVVISFLYGNPFKLILTSLVLLLFSYIPFLVFIPNIFQLLFLSSTFNFFWRVLFTSVILIYIPKFLFQWFFYKRASNLAKNVKNIEKMKSLVRSIEREADMAKV